MVKPLRGAQVADGPGELDAPVWIEQARAHDRHIILLGGGILQAGKPAGPGLHVGVEHDHVATLVDGAQTAVDVGGKAFVALPRYDLDPLDRRKRGEVLGAGGVVGHHDLDHPLGDGAVDALHKRGHPLGVAVAGDHHADRLTVLAIPGQSTSVQVVTHARAQGQAVAQRREAQGEGEHSEQERAPA